MLPVFYSEESCLISKWDYKTNHSTQLLYNLWNMLYRYMTINMQYKLLFGNAIYTGVRPKGLWLVSKPVQSQHVGWEDEERSWGTASLDPLKQAEAYFCNGEFWINGSSGRHRVPPLPEATHEPCWAYVWSIPWLWEDSSGHTSGNVSGWMQLTTKGGPESENRKSNRRNPDGRVESGPGTSTPYYRSKVRDLCFLHAWWFGFYICPVNEESWTSGLGVLSFRDTEWTALDWSHPSRWRSLDREAETALACEL